MWGEEMMCNILTGSGFDTSFMGGWSIALLGIAILFFVIAIARKFLGDEMGVPFSFIGALVLGFIPYLVITSIFCSGKWGLLAGLVGAAIGALGAGSIIGGE